MSPLNPSPEPEPMFVARTMAAVHREERGGEGEAEDPLPLLIRLTRDWNYP